MDDTQILSELRKIHEILDERYKDDFKHREASKKQNEEILGKLAELEPVLKVYRTSLTFSTGVLWLTKVLMKIAGGLGIIVSVILAIKELLSKK